MLKIAKIITYINKNIKYYRDNLKGNLDDPIKQKAFMRICVNIGEACKYLKVNQLTSDLSKPHFRFREIDVASSSIQSIRNALLHDYLYLQHRPEEQQQQVSFFNFIEKSFNQNLLLVEEAVNKIEQEGDCDYKATKWVGPDREAPYPVGDYLYTAACEMRALIELVNNREPQNLIKNKTIALAIEYHLQNIGQCLKEYITAFDKLPDDIKQQDEQYKQVFEFFEALIRLRNVFSHKSMRGEINRGEFGTSLKASDLTSALKASNTILNIYAKPLIAIYEKNNLLSPQFRGNTPQKRHEAQLLTGEKRKLPPIADAPSLKKTKLSDEKDNQEEGSLIEEERYKYILAPQTIRYKFIPASKEDQEYHYVLINYPEDDIELQTLLNNVMQRQYGIKSQHCIQNTVYPNPAQGDGNQPISQLAFKNAEAAEKLIEKLNRTILFKENAQIKVESPSKSNSEIGKTEEKIKGKKTYQKPVLEKKSSPRKKKTSAKRNPPPSPLLLAATSQQVKKSGEKEAPRAEKIEASQKQKAKRITL
jgi:uncharacterized protein with HEPN domain